jgi:hypothetical protein
MNDASGGRSRPDVARLPAAKKMATPELSSLNASMSLMAYEALPGGDLVEKGLRDLARGEETEEALLVSIGAPRLQAAGVEVPGTTYPDPERRLYELLAAEDENSAHSRYNALIRRLVSFEDAAECVGL